MTSTSETIQILRIREVLNYKNALILIVTLDTEFKTPQLLRICMFSLFDVILCNQINKSFQSVASSIETFLVAGILKPCFLKMSLRGRAGEINLNYEHL